MQPKSTSEEYAHKFPTDERFDFSDAGPFRKSYVVASSYRSGSSYFCWLLWATGLLGAPSELLNTATQQMRTMMARMKARSPADYIDKLLERRVSRNGVFGLKAHFPHFEAFLKLYPEFLDKVGPTTYLYIHREDKVAQAVSMAKALQTNQWNSRATGISKPVLRYDRDLISNSLKELDLMDSGWLRWLEKERIEPYRLTYERLTGNPDGVITEIKERLGVQNDEPSKVDVPPAEKQGDDTNEEWIERYKKESATGGLSSSTQSVKAVDVASVDPRGERISDPQHFFERKEKFIKALPALSDSTTGFIALSRLRYRYDAIILQNKEIFQKARVLDIVSHNGFWSLAALDAGAAHVVGLETTQGAARAAGKAFRDHNAPQDAYRFVQTKLRRALKTFEPGQFDAILCKGYFEHSNPVEIFRQFERLQPKFILLDTKIAVGTGPLARFSIAEKKWKESGPSITATPSHDLIEMLCESNYRCRFVDPLTLGADSRVGVHDYTRNTRRTYVLERLPS